MAQLTFTGRSGDGKRLLLVDSSGQEHTLVIDPRLRRALAGAPDSNGQLEIPMESTLRPRDIQARIRAGETPEAVAHAAGTSVEKIMPFAAPVMAERAHMVERAQLASVRRRGGESGARTLGDAVGAHLRSHNVDPDIIEWDAWRREDGRWTLTGLYDVAGRSGGSGIPDQPPGVVVVDGHEVAARVVGEGAGAGAAGDLVERGEGPASVLAPPRVPLDGTRVDVVRAEVGADGLAEGARTGLRRAAAHGGELRPLGHVGTLGHHRGRERHDLLDRGAGRVGDGLRRLARADARLDVAGTEA
jgi:hypothetical protein